MTPCTCYISIINIINSRPPNQYLKMAIQSSLQINKFVCFWEKVSIDLKVRLEQLKYAKFLYLPTPNYKKQYLLVYFFSDQIMKKAQNPTKTKARTLSIKTFSSDLEETESTQPKKENSVPKFNRKTEAKPFSRKKSEAKLENQHPICFISPKRASREGTQFFRSPKFQDVAQKFSAILFESSQGKDSEAGKSTRMSSSAIFQTDLTGRDKINEDSSFYKMEINSLKEDVERLEKQNEKMKNTLDELESLQTFLMERENYIYQLTSENQKTAEDLSAMLKIKEEVEKSLISLKEELKEKTLTYEADNKKLQIKYEAQQAQINLLLKKNIKLKEEIKNLKSNEKQNSFSRHFKENNENFNRKRQRNLIKSKSALLKTAPVEILYQSTDDLEISDIDHKSIQCGNETVVELADMLEEESIFKGSSVSDCFPIAFESLINKPSFLDRQREDCHDTIKKLKQKIRYSEIQIDTLKKIKVDTEKIKEENNKLKNNNRKLLNRIDFISRESRKRQCNCDQSLELSLSPPKM